MKARRPTSRTARRVLLLITGSAVIYFLVPVVLLRFGLERLLIPEVNGGTTRENRIIDVPLAESRSIRIRQYGGSDLQHCVIFFPGRHGGISTYEQSLFPDIQKLGMAVYTLSYPGQDGAQGRSHPATLLGEVSKALGTIGRETSCLPARSVFVGRSLGATVAVYAAEQMRPKGLLLDGVAPSLTVAVNAGLRRHIATRPWTWLPVESLLKNDFKLAPVLQSLQPTPVIVFQGTEDEVTPFAEMQSAVLGYPNVTFFPVPGGTHSNAYQLAMPQYLESLVELVGR